MPCVLYQHLCRDGSPEFRRKMQAHASLIREHQRTRHTALPRHTSRTRVVDVRFRRGYVCRLPRPTASVEGRRAVTESAGICAGATLFRRVPRSHAYHAYHAQTCLVCLWATGGAARAVRGPRAVRREAPVRLPSVRRTRAGHGRSFSFSRAVLLCEQPVYAVASCFLAIYRYSEDMH